MHVRQGKTGNRGIFVEHTLTASMKTLSLSVEKQASLEQLAESTTLEYFFIMGKNSKYKNGLGNAHPALCSTRQWNMYVLNVQRHQVNSKTIYKEPPKTDCIQAATYKNISRVVSQLILSRIYRRGMNWRMDLLTTFTHHYNSLAHAKSSQSSQAVAR
jgi:hypothetical protein